MVNWSGMLTVLLCSWNIFHLLLIQTATV